MDINQRKIILFFKKHEYCGILFILFLLLIIFFFDIVFLNATFSTASITAGTMPNGPYNYSGYQLIYSPVIDAGAPSWCFEPWLYYFAEVFKSGGLPLWYPYQGFGAPLIGDFSSAFFYPINLILFSLPQSTLPFALDMSILFKLLIAGFFTYCFMRELSVSKTGSLASALIFMFNGYFIFYINMAHLNTEVLIPVLFFSLEKLVKKQDFKYTILAAVVVALIIFGGMPESILFALSIGGLYYLFRMIVLNRSDFQIKKLIKPFLLLICVMGIGILIAAPQIIPFVEFLGNSFSAHPTGVGLSGGTFSYDSITLLIPYFFGIIWSTWSGLNLHYSLLFIGVAAVFLALMSYKKDDKYQSFTLFFGAVSIFYVLKFYTVPIVNWVGYLPFYNVSIFSKYLFPEFAFSIAVLAGIGLYHLPQLNLKRILLSFSIIFFIILAFIFANWPAAHQSTWNIAPFGWHFSALSWMILNCTIAIGFLTALTFVAVLSYKNKLNIHYAACIILVLIIAELFIYVPHIHPERVNPYQEPPYISFLKNDSSIYRVVGVDQVLYPDTAAPYQIFDIENIDALNVNRYWRFIEELIDPDISEMRFTGDTLSVNISNSRFLELSNVKYILSCQNLTFGLDESSSFINLIQKQGQLYPGTPGYIAITPQKQDIFAHAPSKFCVNITVPDESSKLLFTYGLDQNTWTSGMGDGVTFNVLIVDNQSNQTVFSQYVNPSGNPRDRQWFSQTVNLSEYRGENVQIQFVTSPGPNGNNAYDRAHWKSVDIVSDQQLEEQKQFASKYTLVYDKEIKIYQDRDVLPRVFVVNDAIVKMNESEIFRTLKDPAFNVSHTVVLETEILEMGNLTNPTLGSDLIYSADIEKYTPNDIIINATLNRPGLLILTDTYYPGWKVVVDGKQQEILAADYLFRAVYLDAGTHYVEYKYEPLSFVMGLVISMATILFISLMYIHLTLKKK